MVRKIFEKDLCHLLNIQEQVFRGNVDHIDYVSSLQYFKDTWGPLDEEGKKPC